MLATSWDPGTAAFIGNLIFVADWAARKIETDERPLVWFILFLVCFVYSNLFAFLHAFVV